MRFKSAHITLPLIAAVMLLVSCCMFVTPACASSIYTPTYVAADGSVGTNAAWEAGQSTDWFIELQRLGTQYIEAGIAQENPTLISQGLLILDWGFNKEASDGSFPGTGSIPITGQNANQATGGVFHTTSLFFEAASRAVIELRAYSPVTYTLDPNFYSGKLESYTSKLEATAKWLTNTSWTPAQGASPVNVPALGFSFDQSYGHRYYLLAAGLQECSQISNDTSLVTGPNGANWWIDQAFPRQLGTGWQAAIPTSTLDGGNTPASLVAPGGQIPSGTGEVITALGVNPERSGYDVSYHMVGCLHASRWYNASTDTTRKAEVVTMLVSALQWERSRTSITGVVDPTGSTRVGVDETQDGSGIKTIATTEVIEAFQNGGKIDRKGRDTLAGIRIQDANTLPSPDPINADGSIGSNTTAAYNIGSQKDCGDWVQQGILLENDAQIQQGLAILNWGLARQAGDGSFPHTHSPYTDTAFFVEAAARTVIMLENYHPISHPLNMSLLSGIGADIAAIDKSAHYLLGSQLINDFASKTSTSDNWLYAAALGEANIVTKATDGTGSTAFQTLSGTFRSKALSLQLPDGTNPESGVFVGNDQVIGVTMAERLITNDTEASYTKTAIKNSISAALVRMELVVNIDGSFTYSSPAIVTAQNAFGNGATITGNKAFEVISIRISTPSLAQPA